MRRAAWPPRKCVSRPTPTARVESRIAFDDAVLRNLREIPGVQAASLISAMPFEGETWIENLRRVDRLEEESPLINLRWVSPMYFETVRQKVVAGRFFEERDRNLNSAIVSESEGQNALAQRESDRGAGADGAGQNVHRGRGGSGSRSASLKTSAAQDCDYLHFKDRPALRQRVHGAGGRSRPRCRPSSMRQAIWRYAPDVTITRSTTLDSQLSDSLSTERFQTSVLSAFGIAALLLAMLGIYGVLSYSTATRRQEIGVRMALGATRAKIYALTLGGAGAPVFAGLGAGFLASIAAGRVIEKLLYGVRAIDPAVMAIVAALFLPAAAVAAFVPARRAASIDPMDALRSE